jgi:hypothetical protein
LLVGLYSRRGDVIVDLTADPFIAGAAGAGGRVYYARDDVGGPSFVDERLVGAVGLVLLRWPAGESAAEPDIDAVFAGCRRLMTSDGCTVVILAPIPPETFYADHARRLIPAARHAGLGYLRHILAVTTPITGGLAHQPIMRTRLPIDHRSQVYLDLLVFVIGGHDG